MAKKKKEKRFVCVQNDDTMLTAMRIYVDTQTGVNYLFVSNSNGGSLTPLLDAYGKVIVSALPVKEADERIKQVYLKKYTCFFMKI